MPQAEVSDEAEDVRQVRLRTRRGRLVLGGGAAAVVAVVGVVALLGGFARRTDLVAQVSPGTVIATGPYELSFTSATVHRTTSDGKWEVDVVGAGRTTGTISINPSVQSGDFVYVTASSGEVQHADLIRLGDPDGADSTENLVPGLPPIPVTAQFELKRDPGPKVLLVVFDQKYTTPYILSQEEGWERTKGGSAMSLTPTRLPDEEY